MKISDYNFSIKQTNNIGSKPYRPALAHNIGNRFSLDKDRFCPSPSFTAKKISIKNVKRIEDQLRNLDGVHDPYSEVTLLSKTKFQQFKEKVKKRSGAESMIKLLSGYTQHMFPDGEARVFELLKYETKQHAKSPKPVTFHDILQEHLLESKTRLVNNQLDVTDYMRDFSRKNFTKEEQKTIKKRLDKVEQDILDDDFRIKPTKKYLEELYTELPNKQKVKELIKITDDFPNGATSIDAFIVKNADKPSDEIAEALISPAQITVEHCKPQSKGGEDKGGNLIAASKRMNNLRGAMSYDEFIGMFPDIPKHTQRYTDDVIKKINRGGITDIAMTMPDVKEGLYKESNGKINLDISEMRTNVVGKIGAYKTKVAELVSFFSAKC